MDLGLGAEDRGAIKPIFTGKWHLGEADYALPTDQGYDEMRYSRPLSSQCLYLRRPDLVPRHGSGIARDVPKSDQGSAVGQGR